MATFLSVIGATVLLLAFLRSIHRANHTPTTPAEPIAPVRPIGGDSRLPSDAFFG